jgi:hypothetical protein
LSSASAHVDVDVDAIVEDDEGSGQGGVCDDVGDDHRDGERDDVDDESSLREYESIFEEEWRRWFAEDRGPRRRSKQDKDAVVAWREGIKEGGTMTTKDEFPILASVARVVLAVPASEIACERLFSKSGRVKTVRRASLWPDRLRAAVMMKANETLLSKIL